MQTCHVRADTTYICLTVCTRMDIKTSARRISFKTTCSECTLTLLFQIFFQSLLYKDSIENLSLDLARF